jgi:hypothetical protein
MANNFQNAMAFLMSAIEGMRIPKKRDLGGTETSTGTSGMTKKGASHKVNPTFLSKPGAQTPSLFRRLHLGATTKKKAK